LKTSKKLIQKKINLKNFWVWPDVLRKKTWVLGLDLGLDSSPNPNPSFRFGFGAWFLWVFGFVFGFGACFFCVFGFGSIPINQTQRPKKTKHQTRIQTQKPKETKFQAQT